MRKALIVLSAGVLLTVLSACNAAAQIAATPVPTVSEKQPTAEVVRTPTSLIVPTAVPTPVLVSPVAAAPTATKELADSPAPIPHLAVGQPITLSLIQMFDASLGWALGGANGAQDHVFRSRDGGLTWQDVTPPEPVQDATGPGKQAIGFFLDPERAWVTYSTNVLQPEPASPLIWRTVDGGKSWEPNLIEKSRTLPSLIVPQPLQFSDDQHGWLMIYLDSGMSHAYVEFFSTQNGGLTWEKLIDPANNSALQGCCKTGMAYGDSKIGLVTNGQGPHIQVFVERTVDGGKSWSFEPLPEPESAPSLFERAYCEAFSPAFFTPVRGLLGVKCTDFDDAASPEYYLFTTGDSGASWQTFPYPGGRLLFIDPMVGWALGREIFQTLDGGNSWERIKTVNWDGQFSFVDGQLGWAVARSGDEIALVRTTDGGRLWEQLNPLIGP